MGPCGTPALPGQRLVCQSLASHGSWEELQLSIHMGTFQFKRSWLLDPAPALREGKTQRDRTWLGTTGIFQPAVGDSILSQSGEGGCGMNNDRTRGQAPSFLPTVSPQKDHS